MSLDPVVKIQIVSHSSSRPALLGALESSGLVHLAEAPGEDDAPGFERISADTASLSENILELDRIIDFLGEYAPKQGFLSGLTQIPPAFSPVELERMASDKDLIWKAGRSWRVAMVLTEREGEARELAAEVDFLESWKGLSIPLEALGVSGSFALLAGQVPAESLSLLQLYEESQPLFSLIPVDGGGESSRVLSVIHTDILEEARQKLSEAGFSQQDFSGRKGRASALLSSASLRLKALANRRERLEAEARQLAMELPRFRALRDAAGLLHERVAAARAGSGSEKTFVLRAWVRRRDLEAVRAAAAGARNAFVEEIQPGEDELPPAAMTEAEPIDPYVMLTDMFGRPAPGDPDPTPLTAPFYALFFGICIGDAGYGLVIALAAGIADSIARRKGRKNRLLRMIFHGGLSAIVAGTFLGGWFGMDASLLPGFLLAPAGLLDSLVPEGGSFALSKQFLYATMALGLVQLTTGIVLNFIKRWRTGERATAILEQTGWLLSLFGLFPWLFNHYLLDGRLYDMAGPLDSAFMYMLLAGAVLIFVMGGRSASGFGRIGLGAMAAYGIVNLLADALSYSRLFALSLSGGIIASVVNQIAGMLPGTDIPVVGLLISVPVILFGHIFNILMSLLGGYIHTARLQFVEYYGKFYEGTGSPFVPFRYDPRFVNIVRKKA